MKITKPSGVLEQYLKDIGVSAKSFHVHDGELARGIAIAKRQHPKDTDVEIEARAIARLAYKQFAKKKRAIDRKWFWAVAALLLALLLAKSAFAQQPVNIDRVGGVKVSGSIPVTGTVTTTPSGTQAVSSTQLPAALDLSGNFKVAIQNASLAVTGTFFQATQPVSIASMPTTPVTGTFWQATQPVSIAATVTVDGSGVTQPVSGTFWQATQPVSGTFYQATQPVSIASMPSTPVTGTFYQATQPVSEADAANVTLGAKADAKSTATDTTAVTIMQVLKQISASVQAPPSQAVTNAGTFATQATLQSNTGVNIGALTANQSVNVAQVGGSTVSTAATGVQKVGIVGNTGATLDGTVVPGTAPTNGIPVLGKYPGSNSTGPTVTSAQTAALNLDRKANLRIVPGAEFGFLSAWTSATALNATQNLADGTGSWSALQVNLTQSGTFSAGAITFEVAYEFDGANWVTIPADAVLDQTSTTYARISLPYTLQTDTYKTFLILNKGFEAIRVKLSTVITGSGSVTPGYETHMIPSVYSTIALSPTAANFNATVVGSGNFATTAADGSSVTLGAKADAKSTATDTTAVTIMSVLKEISAMEQAPASRAVTIASAGVASGAIASGAVASGAVASGAFASGSISDGADVTLGAKADAKSTATDTTAVTIMSVLKEISAMEQAPAALAAGTAVIGKAGIDQTTPGTTNAVEPIPDTASAVALSASGKATVTTSVNVKASAGNVYGFSVTNGAASICWIQFVNNSGNGTLGTLPIFSVALPASGTVNYPPGSFPLANFSSGIAVGISTTVNGASACGTAGNLTVFYK